MFFRRNFDKIVIKKIKRLSKKEFNNYRLFSDLDEVFAWESERYYSWQQSLSDEEMWSIKMYAGNLFASINLYLRGDEREEWSSKYVKDIDSALNKTQVCENIILFRWMSYDGLLRVLRSNRIEILSGETFLEKGFVSTNILFAEKPEEMEHAEVLLIIKAEKGSKGAFINNLSYRGGVKEYEFVLHRDQRFSIEKVVYNRFKRVILLCSIER